MAADSDDRVHHRGYWDVHHYGDRSMEKSVTFPIGTCPSCGGKRIWIDRSFNPVPKYYDIHKKGCVAGKYHSEAQQVKEAKEFGACPVHGTEPLLECRVCLENADRDDWGFEEGPF